MTEFSAVIYSGSSTAAPLLDVLRSSWTSGNEVIDLGTSFRSLAPADTLQIASSHLQAVGVVRVSNITHFDKIGIPVVAATRPNAAGPTVLHGKGMSLDAAYASAVMEAVERFHAEHSTVPVVLASLSHLSRGHPIVDPVRLPGIKGRRFSVDTDIAWSKGVDLRTGKELWLPAELTTVSYLHARPSWRGFFRSETTGIASGNTMLEAIVHAIYEIVERDCRTLFSVQPPTRQTARQIDLSRIEDAPIRGLVGMIEAAGLKALAWDITCDTGIPCYLARILEQDLRSSPHLMWSTGGGSHAFSSVALQRALVEAAQGRAVLMSGSRDDLTDEHYVAKGPAHQRTWRGWLKSAGDKSFLPVSPPVEAGTREELAWIIDRLVDAGLDQIILVELTQPEIGIPVASVWIPWMEDAEDLHNYAPGPRLTKMLQDRHA